LTFLQETGEKHMKTVAYLRVSTQDQDVEKNKSELLMLAHKHNLGKVEFVEEIVSGKVSWKKRKIAQVVDVLNKGDNIILSELSRLGRSMLEVMEILSVCNQRGICIYALKGNWTLNSSIQSKIVAMAYSLASEIERDLISQRTKEALKYRKECGVKLGRPIGSGISRLDQYKPEIKALIANGSTKRFIAERYGTSESNLYRWMLDNKIVK
jgi:DNA invertase Pin-like site-specific DNA recombinase